MPFTFTKTTGWHTFSPSRDAVRATPLLLVCWSLPSTLSQIGETSGARWSPQARGVRVYWNDCLLQRRVLRARWLGSFVVHDVVDRKGRNRWCNTARNVRQMLGWNRDSIKDVRQRGWGGVVSGSSPSFESCPRHGQGACKGSARITLKLSVSLTR